MIHSHVKFQSLALCITLLYKTVFAQSNVHSLKPDVTVEFIKSVPAQCSRIEIDPVSGNVFYLELNGNVHRLVMPGGVVKDTVLYTTAHHHVTNAYGMAFHDSLLFLVGSEEFGTTEKFGLIVRGRLKPNGSRAWDTVAITQTYPAGNTPYDHGFGAITINPAGDSLFIGSGSRSDHGEIESNGGLYPGLREIPLTSALFRIPINSKNLILPDDSASLAPYLFADGLRNTFDLAFNSSGDLIGGENSGERDDPDELNWLRYGRHYGFPWIMGGDYNPQQYPGYDPDNDIMLNKNRYGYENGFFYDDPTFPQKPAGLINTPGIENYGPDADYFRDSATGTVMNVSDLGTFMNGVTPHRSPLGFVFDNNKVLKEGYKGDGFMLSYQLQGDSAGNTPNGLTGTIVDSSQDLVRIHLTKKSSGENYKVTCTRLVGGFFKPVDACMKENIIYVIEYSNGGNPVEIWKVTLPADTAAITTSVTETSLCPGQSVNVSYTTSGIFNPDNIFTAQLSNASGSFSSPKSIGTIVSVSSGTIAAVIPSNTVAGTGYRIRVVSSSPVINGKNNGQNISISCPVPTGLTTSNITANSAKIKWTTVGCAAGYQVKYRVSGNDWISVNANAGATSKKLTGLLPSTSYQWRIRTKCVSDPKVYSPYSTIQNFTTAPLKTNAEASLTSEEILSVYPNPFADFATIEFKVAVSGFTEVLLFDLQGRKVRTFFAGDLAAGNHQHSFSKGDLTTGVYLLQLKSTHGVTSKKLVIE